MRLQFCVAYDIEPWPALDLNRCALRRQML